VTYPRDTLALLADMLGALAEIESFAAIGETAFLADLRTRRAVERSFEILGEAASVLPAGVRERFPEVPWRVVIDHRNRLIHGYATIDPARVWRTIVADLPPLRAQLEDIVTLLKGEKPA
jgi:uncharacterized protein with HEPN domain